MLKNDKNDDEHRFTFSIRNTRDTETEECGSSRNVKYWWKAMWSLVPKYLIENGYNVIPVNPTKKEVLGKKSYASVSEIPEQVDIVDVFRRSKDVPLVVDDAIKKVGIKVIWMQSGIYNKDARKAKENGIDVVYNRCMKVEHSMLID